MKQATKQQLRDEIAMLRCVGAQMANLGFNLGQNTTSADLGRMVSGRNLVCMYHLSKEWDAVKRSEPSK